MDKSRALIDMSKGELLKYIMELEDEIKQLEDAKKQVFIYLEKPEVIST